MGDKKAITRPPTFPSQKGVKVMARWARGWDVIGDSGNAYRVSINDNGDEWGCSCPAWKFRRQTCKHILQIQSEINWQEGNISDVVQLKAKLIERYKNQGKSDEWIINKLAEREATQ